MLKKIRDYVAKWQMLKKEDRVIVGVSGGADSICLLLVLLQLQKDIGFDLVAVHVNHGLRGDEANSDESFVKEFCFKKDIPCACYFADVASIAKKRKQSTEEAGREVRREFFNQAFHSYHGTKIALAHHQDDNAETFLFHVARGTGLKGLGGIAPVNENVIRPLLCVRRKEIEQYLEEQNVSYCVDGSNQSDVYTRNRIRNHVLPYMEQEVNSKVVEHMNETMEQLRQIQDFIEQQVQELWELCVEETKKGIVVKKDLFESAPSILKLTLLKRALATVSRCEKDLEMAHLSQLQELFSKQNGRKIDLPYCLEGKRIYEGIVIRKRLAGTAKMAEEVVYDMQAPEKVFQMGDAEICCKKIEKKTFEKSNTGWFDCDIIKNNLSFRTRREGDYITIHPDGRTQKLKSYFINEKIPEEERDYILLVADGSHILWIVGYRQNCVYQAKEDTKNILEIQINKGENYGRNN